MKTILCGMAVLLSVCFAAVPALALPSYDDVLVVVNDNSPRSLEIGEYFRTARKISDVNVCHISETDYQVNGGEDSKMSLA
jgi:hypothetical protein